MTLFELTESAALRGISPSEIEQLALELASPVPSACDAFAREVADAFISGRCSWEQGDRAMNALYAAVYVKADFGLTEFAWSVYSAFDEGEYIHPESKQEDGESRTRVLLLPLVAPGA